MKAPTTRTISPELTATAIYDGRQHCGDVVEHRNGQYEAALPTGESLGLFTSVVAAMHAVIAAGRQGGDR